MSDVNFSSLNEAQKEAVLDTIGPSLIIAGAGSGKTRVLTERIAQLLSDGIYPSRILAITFTNKAAREMKERLYRKFDKKSLAINCSTIHSLCARILREDIDCFPDRKRDFVIIDDDDSEQIIKKCLEELNIDSKQYRPSKLANYISGIKSLVVSVNDIEGEFKYIIERVMDAYNEKLIKDNLLDFDDLQLLVYKLFKEFPQIKEKYQDRFEYVLVDEFQDTSNIQYDIVKMLGEKNRNIFIVGDEDQSIYSFRGANIANIRKFMRDFPDHSKHVLDINYRSSQEILDVANNLISHNSQRIKKELKAHNGNGHPVSYFVYDSDLEEAKCVCDTIEELLHKGYNYRDFTILYRNNNLSLGFERELVSRHIPYIVYSGLSFFKRREVKDMVSYIRFIVDHNDLFSFKRIINVPKRGIGPAAIEKIEESFRQTNDLFKSLDLVDLSSKAREEINKFKDLIISLSSSIKEMDLIESFGEIYSKTGYESYILSLDEDESDKRDRNVKELLNAITVSQIEGDTYATYESFAKDVSLMSEEDTEEIDPNHVSLITMHSAKGLEFKGVFVTCLEETFIPGQNVFELSSQEEERRLFYVAITRAKELLFLSYARRRMIYGRTQDEYPSRFIKDLGLVSRTPIESKIYQSSTVKTSETSGQLKVGDRVSHDIYGKGIIIDIVDNFYLIKFDSQALTRKIIINHPLLRRSK